MNDNLDPKLTDLTPNDQTKQPNSGSKPDNSTSNGGPARVEIKTKTRQSHPKLKQWLITGLLVLLIGFGGGYLGGKLAGSSGDTGQGIDTQRVIMSEQSDLISSIVEEVGPSVVSVNVTSRTSGSGFFGGQSRLQESSGTGVIVSSDGLVLTNRHVVPVGTTKVNLVLSDGTVLDDVEVVDRTSDNDSLDIAFLQIKDRQGIKLQAAKLGDSSEARVGDTVVAIGNALGYFQNTVTTGILSGYGRSIQAAGDNGGVESLEDMFQTDAAINQGNSGGPLVNLNGEVIGINTAVAAGSAENMGFAIPINNIIGLIDSVKATGEIQRPYLGVVYVQMTADLAKQFDLAVDQGAYIPLADDYGSDTVLSNGPAGSAGVKEGDVLVSVDDKSIDNKTSLSAALSSYSPGDKVKLGINRDGKSLTIDITLANRPD